MIVNILDSDAVARAVAKALRQLEDHKKLMRKIAERAVDIAQEEFSNAIYSGENDVKVRMEETKEGFDIIAEGESVLFIEFGTGVVTEDNHPEKPPEILARGTYGLGKGSDPNGWTYQGSPGNNTKNTDQGNGRVHTYGDPANQCMYRTIQRLKQEFGSIDD